MVHLSSVTKLKRKKSHRDALVKNLVKSLVLYGKVDTTEAKARVLKASFDRLVRNAKNTNQEFAFRLVNKTLNDETLAKSFFKDVLPKLEDKNSGYTKVFKLNNRPGDGALVIRVQI